MKIRLWGVRGSIPCPGPDTVQFGGNTTCLELRFGEKNRLIIIDAGSGIRLLANHLLKNDLPNGPIEAEIFFTHTHWDHVMGFPFFIPNYIKGTKLKIYGPVTHEQEKLDKIIGGQLSYRYFPIRMDELSAEITYEELKECEMDLGDGIKLKTKYLNHPILCLGYRFEYQGKVFCTGFDTEPFLNFFPTDPKHPDFDEEAAAEGELAAKEENRKILEFYKGADLLIHDAQYEHSEYLESKIGWGHSSYEYAINSAYKARVKKLVLFHHDINRTDEKLIELEKHYRSIIKDKSGMEILMAREGAVFKL